MKNIYSWGDFMDGLYYFVLASVIATFGVGFLVRNTIRKIFDDFGNRNAIQTKMFIYIAIIEAIPIILIIFGFLNIENSTADLIIPIIIVAASTLLNILLIFSTSLPLANEINTSREIKEALSTTAYIGIALVMSFPIIFTVACILTL